MAVLVLLLLVVLVVVVVVVLLLVVVVVVVVRRSESIKFRVHGGGTSLRTRIRIRNSDTLHALQL